MLQGNTTVDIQATISLKNRRFDEKSPTKSTTAGTHREAHYGSVSKQNNIIELTKSSVFDFVRLPNTIKFNQMIVFD